MCSIFKLKLLSESKTLEGGMLDVRDPCFTAEIWKLNVLIIPVTLTQTAHLTDNMIICWWIWGWVWHETSLTEWQRSNEHDAALCLFHSTPSSLHSVDINENNKHRSATDAPSMSTLVFVRGQSAVPNFFCRAFVFQFLLDGVLHIYWITKKNSLRLSWLCNLICAIQLNRTVTVTLYHTRTTTHTYTLFYFQQYRTMTEAKYKRLSLCMWKLCLLPKFLFTKGCPFKRLKFEPQIL